MPWQPLRSCLYIAPPPPQKKITSPKKEKQNSISGSVEGKEHLFRKGVSLHTHGIHLPTANLLPTSTHVYTHQRQWVRPQRQAALRPMVIYFTETTGSTMVALGVTSPLQDFLHIATNPPYHPIPPSITSPRPPPPLTLPFSDGPGLTTTTSAATPQSLGAFTSPYMPLLACKWREWRTERQND